ncbi:CST complex subunit TEN1 [Herrania umbratica]|uniref:CST complex subunit TEN1 n=1 Tax=Herrania umbratica TaxID=108875 RepID=A0A6J1A6E3_9ROSI|nr:CST complex subunit TEN1 [Herrania umbratica]
MASPAIKPGALVTLPELQPSSEFFKEGASLRVTGKLQEYSVETAIAVIADESATLKVDTQHLRELSFRVGSIFQFIGELHIQPNNEAILQARAGRNVDGIDLNLYHQALQLVRQFQAERMNNATT